MADFKEINAEKFKENLVSNFGDNDKVNIFFEELVKQNTDKNPFFYSLILQHIKENHLSITDLVDSSRQVHFEQINVAIFQAHKEYKEKIADRENSEKQKNQNQQINNEEINKTQEFENRFKLIDFENLKDDDIFFGLKNIRKFLENANEEQYNSFKIGLAETCTKADMSLKMTEKTTSLIDMLNSMIQNGTLTYTEEDIPYLEAKGILKDGQIIINDENIEKVARDVDSIADVIQLKMHIKDKDEFEKIINSKNYENERNLIALIGADLRRDVIEGNRFQEYYQGSSIYEQEELEKIVFSEHDDSVIEAFEAMQDVNSNGISNSAQIIEANELSESYFANEFDTEMQAENEQYIDAKMAVTKDYAEMGLEGSDINLGAAEAFWGDEFGDEEFEDIGQDVVELENKTQQVKPMEPEVKVQEAFELDPIDQAEVEQKVQEEIDNSDYQQEIDEKTGIAGLFAAIANSRVGRAVKNLFKTKDAQKKLNAPVTQRTEDGLKITEYESNGSLMPTTIQARNFLRDFAVNTVEAVTNFANNISDAIRGSKKDEVINKPTIIKSEPVQEQADKVEQQPVVEQIQEKTETFNDTNKWAVSNESRQRRQAEIDAQRKVTQSVTKQLETQEQNNSDKSGPMIGE